jgi:hypothetical protein
MGVDEAMVAEAVGDLISGSFCFRMVNQDVLLAGAGLVRAFSGAKFPDGVTGVGKSDHGMAGSLQRRWCHMYSRVLRDCLLCPFLGTDCFKEGSNGNLML